MLYTLWKTPSLLYLLEGMRTFKFCSLNTFQLYKTVLSAKVIILYNGSTGVTYLATESLYLLTKLSLFLPPLFSSLFLWVCFFFFFSPHGKWYYAYLSFSLLFSCSVMSDSATPWTAGHQPPLTFTISQSFLNLMSIESLMHPTLSSSVALFSSCPQSLPASGSFSMSWLFASDGQSIGASASASVFPMNIHGRFSLGLTSLILAVQGILKSPPGWQFESIVSLVLFFFLLSSSHIHTWLLEKP